MAREKLPASGGRSAELDFARVGLMLGIIVIHCTSRFIYAESGLTLFGMNLAFLLNQAVRFSVPGFVLLSGTAVSLGKSDEPPLRFYLGRFKKLIPPYLFWYTLCWLYQMYANAMFSGGAGALIRAYLHGVTRGAWSPHLYFVPVICQMYLLYPLLRYLMRRAKRLLIAVSLLLTLFFQTAIYLTCFGPRILGPLQPDAWLLFPTWLFYFVLGMCVTRERLARLVGFTRKYVLPLALCSVVCALLVALESKLVGSADLSIKPWLLVYTPLVLMTLLGVGGRLSKSERLCRAAGRLSDISLTVYFSHVLIMGVLLYIPLLSTGMRGMLLLLVAVTVLAVIFSECWRIFWARVLRRK